MNHPPVILHRAGIGLLFIYSVGIIAFGLATLYIDLLFTKYHIGINDTLILLVLSALLDLFMVYLAVYIYQASRFILTPQHITVIRQFGLFAPQTRECDMTEVRNVLVSKRGFLSSVFDYGTLTVQTAGTYGDLVLPTIPQPEQWQNYILQAHDQSVGNTTVSSLQ